MEKQTKKPAESSLLLPTKYIQQSPKLSQKSQRQSSSEFPIQDRKGKGKVKSLSDEDKEIKELIDGAMSEIIGALHIKETPNGLDYIITQGLAGDNWIDNPPPASKHYWTGNPSGLTTHKPMPSSSQIKDLEPKYFNRDGLLEHLKLAPVRARDMGADEPAGEP